MLVVLVLSVLKPSAASHRSQQAWFVGFTNGAPSTFANTLSGHHGEFIRKWLASGTNVALFTITNHEGRSIVLYPYVGFYDSTNTPRQRYGTVLQNAPDAYGIFLRPGEATVVEVPILPQDGPGTLRFGYSPDYYHFFPRITEELRGLVLSRKRADFKTEWFFSTRIEP